MQAVPTKIDLAGSPRSRENDSIHTLVSPTLSQFSGIDGIIGVAAGICQVAPGRRMTSPATLALIYGVDLTDTETGAGWFRTL